MVAVAAADDGVALAVAQASAKLLASPEVDELEADYAKSGYCLAAGLLGGDEVKTTASWRVASIAPPKASLF
jgi:hypothetical protein